jgi:hypothetical protein
VLRDIEVDRLHKTHLFARLAWPCGDHLPASALVFVLNPDRQQLVAFDLELR